MLTAENLTRLLDLARSAAPGPWEWEHRHTDSRYGGHVYSKVEQGPDEFEAFDGSYHGRLIAESLSREHAPYFAALSPEVITALIPIVQHAKRWSDLQISDDASEACRREFDVICQALHRAVLAAFGAPKNPTRPPQAQSSTASS